MQAADSGCAWVNWRRLQEGEWNNFSRVCGQQHGCIVYCFKVSVSVVYAVYPTLHCCPCLRAYEHRAAVGTGLSETARNGCDYPSFYLYEMTETETKDHPCAQALLQLCRNIARLCDCCGMAGRLKDCREGRREGRVRCRGMHSRSHITFWACGEASINIRRVHVC